MGAQEAQAEASWLPLYRLKSQTNHGILWHIDIAASPVSYGTAAFAAPMSYATAAPVSYGAAPVSYAAAPMTTAAPVSYAAPIATAAPVSYTAPIATAAPV